jgi:putative hydrolase of the HAD superfamily
MARLNIVFDFGAVIFGWEPSVLVREVFPQQASTDAQAMQLARSIFSHADWHAFDAGTLSADEVVSRTQQRTGLPLQALRELVDSIGHRLMPMAESVAVLQALRDKRQEGADIKLYYLSNMPEPYARVLEKKHPLIGWFDDGIFSGDVMLIKPEPGIFHLATQRFGLQADSQTIFIDDLQTNIDASIAHGWRGVHLPRAHELRSRLFDEIGI